MTRYRKLAKLVSAVRVVSVEGEEVTFDGGDEETDLWLRQAMAKGVGEEGGLWVVHDGLRIGTMEGILHVAVGDYVVQGSKGEIYPVKPDVFADNFEPDGH